MDYLIAKHLKKRYQSRLVVKDVSLTIRQGNIVGLLGPNGAGKTTSFYMIVGLISCDGGEVFLGNQAITHYPIHQRARLGLGYLPQETSIFRKLSVSENILSILQLQKSLSAKQQKRKLDELLEEFHITHLYNAPALTLSGGERRRVEIARALATNPKFLLLDEPFAGIDPISVIDIKHIIKYLSQKGLGILLTDHNAVETLNICQYAYIVHEGSIMAEGTPQMIATNSQVRKVYLGDEIEI